METSSFRQGSSASIWVRWRIIPKRQDLFFQRYNIIALLEHTLRLLNLLAKSFCGELAPAPVGVEQTGFHPGT